MEIDIETKTVTLRCKSSTDANKLAGSIFSVRQVNSESRIIIRVIGAGALNQATKACILANKYFIKQGVTLALATVVSDGRGFHRDRVEDHLHQKLRKFFGDNHFLTTFAVAVITANRFTK